MKQSTSAGVKSVMMTLPVFPSCDDEFQLRLGGMESVSYLERTVQSLLEPSASGTEYELVDLPMTFFAENLRVCQVSRLEQAWVCQH